MTLKFEEPLSFQIIPKKQYNNEFFDIVRLSQSFKEYSVLLFLDGETPNIVVDPDDYIVQVTYLDKSRVFVADQKLVDIIIALYY